MAPTSSEAFLTKRYSYCYDSYGYTYQCNSSWNSWGRWVATGVVILAFILLAFLFSCYNTRRRRRQGMQPRYGMGWMAQKPPGQQPGYYPNAAPPYTPQVENQYTGNTFNSNEGYYGNHGNQGGYGGQQSGIELQQPQNAYQPQRGGEPVYEAPYGPPPKKGDHIIQ